MPYQKISEGFISQRPPDSATSIAAGSRCVLGKSGDLICTFVVQAQLGRNDFKPMIARSSDQGKTWSEAQLIWPELQETYSIFGSISSGPDGRFYFYGMRTPIAYPEEIAWSEETQGLKQNELVWSRSSDEGRTWTPFAVIPMPIPGSAEAAGAMSVTRAGVLVCCYAPYNTHDSAVVVPKNQVIFLASEDDGRTWRHSSMLRFPQPESLGAESWVVELADGRLVGTGWHISGDESQPNAYAVSSDVGRQWSATGSTGTLGQSTSLAPLPDGRVLFIYNQRKHGDIGVWLATAKPTAESFGVLSNERIWAAEVAYTGAGSPDFKGWTNFAFGEPSVTPLPDGTLFITLWALQPSGHGIRYVKLRLQN